MIWWSYDLCPIVGFPYENRPISGRKHAGRRPVTGRVPPDLTVTFWSTSAETSFDVRAIAVWSSYEIQPMSRIPFRSSLMLPDEPTWAILADVRTSYCRRLICNPLGKRKATTERELLKCNTQKKNRPRPEPCYDISAGLKTIFPPCFSIKIVL